MSPPTHRPLALVLGLAVVLAMLPLFLAPGTAPDPRWAWAPLESPVASSQGTLPGGFHDLGPVSPSTTVTATLTLAPRDPSALLEYDSLVGVNEPALTPSQRDAEFGPEPSATAQLGMWLAEHGLSVRSEPYSWVWLVSGPAAGFASAFDTQLGEFSSVGTGVEAAYTTTPSLPSDLPVLALSSPSSVGGMMPASLVQAPTSAAQPAKTASCPGGALSPAEVQGAYNVTPVLDRGIEGQGETIGIVDAFDSADKESRIQSDLDQFSGCEGLPETQINFAYPVPGNVGMNSTNSSGWGLEIALDTQWAHATAPLANITLALSPNNAYGLYYDLDYFVATRSVDVVSLSWGEPERGVYNLGPCSDQCNASSDGSMATLGTTLAAAAAEGMSVFVASGDCGANGGTPQYSPWYPASDPNAVGVGGTVLNVTGDDGYGGETAWSGTETLCENGGGSGGGFSSLPRPSWQAGPGFAAYPQNTTRGVPDVSITAGVPLEVVYGGSPTAVYGTSDAAPQWAGLDALIAEGRGGGVSGFLPPQLYGVLGSSEYTSDFHPVLHGWNGYLAGYGWNPVTGIGTPNFASLYATLTDEAPLLGAPEGTFNLTLSPAAVTSGTPVTLAAGPVGPGADVARYQYVWGDTGPPYQQANATTTASSNVSYEYGSWSTPRPGGYTAWAVAYLAQGGTAISNPVAVNVGNAGPIALTARTPASVTLGEPTVVNVTAGGGEAPYRFSYFWGDGTYETSWGADGPEESHTYLANGSYVITVIANDSSDPQRAGSVQICATVGPGPADCPSSLPALQTYVEPASTTLTSGGSTQVQVHVSVDGAPVDGAQLTLSGGGGTLGATSGSTSANGTFVTTFTAPLTSQTDLVGIFANATLPGYVAGAGASSVVANPATGPSLLPWVRFAQDPGVAGGSDGLLVGGEVAVVATPLPGVALFLNASGGSLGSAQGALDPSALFGTTWTLPSSGSEANLTLTLTEPGWTSDPVTFSLPLRPASSGYPVQLDLTESPASVPSLGVSRLGLVVANGSGGPPPSVSSQNLSLDIAPYGTFTGFQSQGPGTFTGEVISPAIPTFEPAILSLNLTGAAGATVASALALLEVRAAVGNLTVSLTPVPAQFTPGASGNLSILVSSVRYGVPLGDAFMVVTPQGGSSDASADVGWTNASGIFRVPWTAPRENTTVSIEVQAFGFYYNDSTVYFNVSVAAPVVVQHTQGTQGWTVLVPLVALGFSSALIVLLYRRPPRSPAPAARAAPATPTFGLTSPSA